MPYNAICVKLTVINGYQIYCLSSISENLGLTKLLPGFVRFIKNMLTENSVKFNFYSHNLVKIERSPKWPQISIRMHSWTFVWKR